jgi:zinc transport system permease protein
MNSLLEIISQPFMLRAIYGGILVSLLCAVLGVFVILREKSFIADGIAHGALAGVSLGLVINFEPFILALIVGILMAIGITYIQKNTNISQDAVIGIFFSTLFAIGIIILSFSNTFQPDIVRYLFGSILFINWTDIIYLVLVLSATLLIVTLLYKRLVYATLDPEAAEIRGINVTLIEYIINILIAASIIVSIKLVGIVLVTALLIIPASSAKLLAKNFKQMIPISILQTLLSTIVGILVSILSSTPTGPVIVVVSACIFFVIFLYSKLAFD